MLVSLRGMVAEHSQELCDMSVVWTTTEPKVPKHLWA